MDYILQHFPRLKHPSLLQPGPTPDNSSTCVLAHPLTDPTTTHPKSWSLISQGSCIAAGCGCTQHGDVHLRIRVGQHWALLFLTTWSRPDKIRRKGTCWRALSEWSLVSKIARTPIVSKLSAACLNISPAREQDPCSSTATARVSFAM